MWLFVALTPLPVMVKGMFNRGPVGLFAVSFVVCALFLIACLSGSALVTYLVSLFLSLGI
jgi:hypothetical protein